MSTLSVRYGARQQTKNPNTAAEVLLWTNPNPATARSSLDATLSQSIRNFSRIRIAYSYNTGSESASYSAFFPVLLAGGDYMFPSGTTAQRMVIGLNNASGNHYVRLAYVVDDTTIHFMNAYRVNASGNTNTNLIPWYIYGIK